MWVFLVLILLSLGIFLIVRPLWSAFLRAAVLLLLILFLVDPVFHSKQRVPPRVALVVDVSRSAYHLLDFYREQAAKYPFSDIYALGDTIREVASIDEAGKPEDGTNFNNLSRIHGHDAILFLSDGWHNAPQDVDYQAIPSPVYVVIPPHESAVPVIRDVMYPSRVSPGENVRVGLRVFSPTDTTLPFSLMLADTVVGSVNLARGENDLNFLVRASDSGGLYYLHLRLGDSRRVLPVRVESRKRYVLLRVGRITPEVGLLRRLLLDYGFASRILLDTVVVEDAKGILAFTISFYKDSAGDVVYGRAAGYDTVLVQLNGRPVAVEKGEKVYVVERDLWRLGRRDFEAYRRIMMPVVDRVLSRKPYVDVRYRVQGDMATVEVISSRQDITVKFNDTVSISRVWTGRITAPETVKVEVFSSIGTPVLRRRIVLEPGPPEREVESGVDSIALATLSLRTGGRVLRSADELKKAVGVRTLEKEIHLARNPLFLLLMAGLLLLDIFLRRRSGYR